MILAVDSSALALLVNPAANPPTDPATGRPTEFARERVAALLAGLGSTDTLIVPTPVLAEVLVGAGDAAPEVLERLSRAPRIHIRSFDIRAAVETAMMTRAALEAGDKFGGSGAPWQRVKLDRQIIAVARVHGATRLYADDANMVAFARRLEMDAVSTWELPIPDRAENLFTRSGRTFDGAPRATDE